MNAVEVARYTQQRITLDVTDAPTITWAGGIEVAPRQVHVQVEGGKPTVVFVTGKQTKGAGVRDGGTMSNCWPVREAPDWVQHIVEQVTT